MSTKTTLFGNLFVANIGALVTIEAGKTSYHGVLQGLDDGTLTLTSGRERPVSVYVRLDSVHSLVINRKAEEVTNDIQAR